MTTSQSENGQSTSEKTPLLPKLSATVSSFPVKVEREQKKSQDPGETRPYEHSIFKTKTKLIKEDALERLEALQALHEQGFIGDEELERRKTAIIDEVTRTSGELRTSLPPTIPLAYGNQQRPALQSQFGCPQVIYSHPPLFIHIPSEIAIRHSFNYQTRRWESSEVTIKLDQQPFAKGSLRIVYHLQFMDTMNHEEAMINPSTSFVAKLAIDPDEDPETYFRDIELQAHCGHYANIYNEHNPPKRVHFVKAWVLELVERGGALCGVERYIEGVYKKHNNNYGSVSDDERNTPQAFSHFTYEASKRQLLAVDIQGVGDLYTDPQIHTINGNDFGKGNLGLGGFHKFLASHRCNSICRYLKLPPINPKQEEKIGGTVPIQKLMNRDAIHTAEFQSKHYYEHAPNLQKFIVQCREEEKQRHTDGSCCDWVQCCIIQ